MDCLTLTVRVTSCILLNRSTLYLNFMKLQTIMVGISGEPPWDSVSAYKFTRNKTIKSIPESGGKHLSFLPTDFWRVSSTTHTASNNRHYKLLKRRLLAGLFHYAHCKQQSPLQASEKGEGETGSEEHSRPTWGCCMVGLRRKGQQQ
ncbi:uncharacterized protein LOC123519913 isoform X2 [Portunus trituberculatus]|uniref:uncharacterized protein LOC123519913 isoform X2 n=1 Tax=Portunus trituberculatus TaxID=210409 RepID=UPI001E1CEF8A|nr:uncharacterized protein LOC123519913 isoform X2 [Portunus trituberculatus]